MCVCVRVCFPIYFGRWYAFSVLTPFGAVYCVWYNPHIQRMLSVQPRVCRVTQEGVQSTLGLFRPSCSFCPTVLMGCLPEFCLALVRRSLSLLYGVDVKVSRPFQLFSHSPAELANVPVAFLFLFVWRKCCPHAKNPEWLRVLCFEAFGCTLLLGV